MARRKVRRGLILGGGGMLGGAWSVGALTALRDVKGFEPNESEIIVGTSAGSVLGSLLAAGVTVDQLRKHQFGDPVVDGPLAGFSWDYEKVTGHRPPVPRLRGPGSARLIGQGVRRLGKMPPTAFLSAFLPAGKGSLERVGHLIDAITPMEEWSPHPNLWIIAMDYETGKRVIFGKPGSPAAPLSLAVMASCAIPGWFQPVEIDGRVYVDGGACSATSVDVVAQAGLDEVYVVAPMVSFTYDSPDSVMARLERRWRVQVTKRCMNEVAKVRAAGTKVTVIGPGAEDLEAIGGNLMDVDRRMRVLETSLRTSAELLTDPKRQQPGQVDSLAG